MKIIVSILIMTLACGAAWAGIEWTWVNAGTGTEQGTFITDGELVSDLAPAGTYTVQDYSITASAHGMPIGSASGGEYFINQPDIGFDWDGSAPTLFWRDSGGYTNGLNLFMAIPVPSVPNMIGMDIDWFALEEDVKAQYLEEALTPILTPVGTIMPNERATFGDVKALYR
jgi:hypothetical protein